MVAPPRHLAALGNVYDFVFFSAFFYRVMSPCRSRQRDRQTYGRTDGRMGGRLTIIYWIICCAVKPKERSVTFPEHEKILQTTLESYVNRVSIPANRNKICNKMCWIC